MKTNIEHIMSKYQNDAVASAYIDERFSKPLGHVQHRYQLSIINDIIKKLNPKNVLEIACGPARLTKDIRIDSDGIAIDSSFEMLEIAMQRVGKNKHWSFVKTDIFNPGLNKTFPLIYSFRFIRHFHYSDRMKIYEVIRSLLDDRGIIVFDAVHYEKIAFINRMENRGQKKIYDKIYYRHQELETELKSAGYDILELKGIIHHFYLQAVISRLSNKLSIDKVGQKIIMILEKFPHGRPLEWVVICRKMRK